MPKLAEALTALEVKRLTEPGLHAVGTVAGLRLLVKPTGARSWVLRTMVGTRRAELGLGGYPTVTLAQAHDRARTALDQIRAGIDPTAERRSKRNTVEWTFERTALAYIAAHAPSWKNEKHGQQWGNTLTAYAFPVFGHKHVRDVTKADVLAAIEPIWSTKNETATRVRNRIELVLNYAVQRELRPEGLNPARWSVMAQARDMVCGACNHRLPVSMQQDHIAAGLACLRNGCIGHYRVAPMRKRSTSSATTCATCCCSRL